MSTINDLLFALEERTIAQKVGKQHDEARMSFSANKTTIGGYTEFIEMIGRYYNHHYQKAISKGTRFPKFEAEERAKEIIAQAYRRQNGDVVMAYNDAYDGTNGGMRGIFDLIADGIRQQSIERYIGHVFDQYVSPISWEDKVELVRDFIAKVGHTLSSSIHRHQPERYARDYKELVSEFAESLKRPARQFRRY